MLEEQSHALMIEGVLVELAPKVETVKARGAEEEEGSSSTPGKMTTMKGVMPSIRIKLMTLQRNKLNNVWLVACMEERERENFKYNSTGCSRPRFAAQEKEVFNLKNKKG